MSSQPNQQQVDFTDEKVTIVIPDHGGRRVGVRKLSMPALSSLPAQSNFRPFRLVINFEFFDLDQPDQVVTSFDPEVSIYISYDINDLYRASLVSRPLKLAFWNGTQWVPFTSQKHKFELVHPATGTVGSINITAWNDPPIGWGT
jgi:hypothetical protein